MQTSSRLREKFDSAEINPCRQSRIRECADIGVCEICSGANAEYCRERHGDYECGRFPAVAIRPKTNRNIRNNQRQKKPEEHRVSWRRSGSPPRKQPQNAANYIRNRAKTSA